MTLYDLLNGTTIMGDVRLSKWVEDFEIVLFQTYGTDHFGPGDIPEELVKDYLYKFYLPERVYPTGSGILTLKYHPEKEE